MAPSHSRGFSVDLCLLLLTLLQATLTDAFNLDVRFPIVKEGSTNGSLFGLSVAFHKQTQGVERYLALVGAPKETDAAGNQTGDVFFCPISADRRDCGRMHLATSEPFDAKTEILDGMWLGVSVASQNITNGRVLACGHRYVKKMYEQTRYSMIGRCYVRSNNMQLDPDDSHWEDYYEVCNPLDLHTEEGMCTLGISALITRDEVVAGSPGSYDWQGNSHMIWRSPDDDYTIVASGFEANDTRRNIYMGYAVAKEKGVLSQTEDTLITGAPRDGPQAILATGSVMLNLVKSVKNPLVIGKNSLYGEQVGSYFGSSIAVADLNNDGWKDLIVGAPFYFDRLKEGGAVYIYMNQNGFFQNKYDVALRGREDSAFGMAVAAIGDIDQDGFQDFAVGAPYHDGGSVFIYSGGANGVSPEPRQEIKGKDITGGGFRTFGYSVSGGMDIDDNSYPDVVVGSLDDRIAVLRARPVIRLKIDFSVTPEIVDSENCVDCVEAKVCLSYHLGTGESGKRNVTVEFALVADVTRHTPRLEFVDSGSNKLAGVFYMPSQKCRLFKLRLKNKPIKDKVAEVKFSLNTSLYEPKPEARGLQDLDAYPVLSEGKAIVTKYEIHFQKACGIDNKCNSNLKMAAQFASFANDQPLEDAEGHQIFKYNSSVKKLVLRVDISNPDKTADVHAEDAHVTVLNITVPPALQYSSVNPKNLICSGSDLGLLCEFTNPIGRNQEIQVEIVFETSGINLDTRNISAEIQMSTLSEQSPIPPIALLLLVEYLLQPVFIILPRETTTFFSGKVMGESAMETTSDVGSPLKFTFEVKLVGRPLGSLGTLQVAFDWPFEVSNGKWLLYLTKITTAGTSGPCIPPEGNVVNPLRLQLTDELSRRRRRELTSLVGGEGEEGKEEEGSLQADQALSQAPLKAIRTRKKLISLSCDRGAKCHTFTCPLKDMNTSATVTVHARLWNSTMLEDYTDAYRVKVTSQATLSLQTSKATVIMKPETQAFTVNIDADGEEEAPSEAPLWIIVVSVLAGVLLLALIIILLWKCGFFKRASTRELYEAKDQKAEMRIQPSENDRLTDDM